MQPPAAPESGHRRGSSATSAAAAPRRSVGCMAGLLRLFSPYHRSHHRKRLTARSATPAAASSAPPSPPPQLKKEPLSVAPSPSPVPPRTPVAVRRRRSCDAPRSPTIEPEHRRASCDSPRPPPPAIVARLMGLEESAPPSPAATAPPPRPLPTRPPPPPPPEMAAEKRQKLLGALEKCDEDLKTLRRIIAAVRAAEMRAVAASAVSPPAGAERNGPKWMDGRDERSPSPSPPLLQRTHTPPAGELYPSPDSVLDAITSPRFPCRKRPSPCTNLEADSKPSAAIGSRIVKPSRTVVFSGDHCKMRPAASEAQAHAAVIAAMCYHRPLVAIEAAVARWMPPEAAAAGSESWRRRRRWGPTGRSRAMVESVGEMWGQGAGEERCEAGRVGAALERAILHDLVADVVAELLTAQPWRADAAAGARKRLCF